MPIKFRVLGGGGFEGGGVWKCQFCFMGAGSFLCHRKNLKTWAASIRHLMWKTLCNFELQIWPEIITSSDAESTGFKEGRPVMWSFMAFLGQILAGKITSRDKCFLPKKNIFLDDWF